LLELCHWVAEHAFRRKPSVALALGTMLLKVGVDVLKPWPMLFLLDYVLGGKDMPPALNQFASALPGTAEREGLVLWTVASTVVIFLLSWALNLANSYANVSLGQRMVYDLAGDLFAKLQQLSLHFHLRKAAGDTIRRVTTDCTCVSAIAKDALLPILSAFLSLVVMFTILWRVSPGLTLLALAVVPCLMWIFHLYAQPMLERSHQQQEIEGRIYNTIERTFSAMPVVQAFGREDLSDHLFQEANRETMTAVLSLTRIQIRFKVLMGLTTATATAGLLWFGASQALRGEATVGVILLFLSYLASLYTPIETVMYTSATIQGAAGSAVRVREILSERQTVTDKPGAIALSSVRGEVRFEDVSFGYERGRAILRGITLQANPGDTIALVGATGAGKSTLVSLLPRFFDPWQGRVLLDNHDLRVLQLKSLRQHVAVVLQDPFLFPVSVSENIAYGQPNATLAEIEAAARAAGAHEFIQGLPGGYRSILGERGATLSGGQRQRLSIARALLKNAPVLILDEPTSALDAETEAALLQALDRLLKGRTTFIIAHRLSTVRRADRIVVLDEGRIVESGRHAQLLAAGGHYARLHQVQFGTSLVDQR
jgi:ATP-binding cassette subfamily B protein/subfamily B ATP-binding cassette protein MsbA